jgi:hypothetical protein
VAEDASQFFFPAHTHWTSLSEVRLDNGDGQSADNIDLVLVAYDERGQLIDFGALEVQAVYISGNVRRPFVNFQESPKAYLSAGWPQRDWPRPDYLSSSRKRLAPQLLYKGGILHQWGKKEAVALQRQFFETLPPLPEVYPEQAEIAWLIYDLLMDEQTQRLTLTKVRTVYSRFQPALERITMPPPGRLADFAAHLQARLDTALDEGYPPDAPTLSEPLSPESDP